ncbi:MAG: hypothetical protein WBL44_07305 [Nitrososphaeraceae archaeon]
MPCRNICTRIGSSFGYYGVGIGIAADLKYFYFMRDILVCVANAPLRTSPNNRRGKEKLRAKQQRVG